MVCDFFGQSIQPASPRVANTAATGNNQPLVRTNYHRDATTSTDGNFVPCTLSSGKAVVLEIWRDRGIDQCTQTDAHRFDALANSYSNVSVPQTVADTNGVFHTGTDTTISSHSSTDVDHRVNSVNGDGLSSPSYDSVTLSNAVGADYEDTQNPGLWKRFDENVWHMEQEKLKQMSLNLPTESDTKDDQVPDLSSSDRLSAVASRLYDSIYGGHSTSSTHRVLPARSLSSVWMHEQYRYASRAADQPATSVSVQKSECVPRSPIREAITADRRHTESIDASSHNVCESEVGNSQSSPYNCLPQSQFVQQMPAAEQSLVTAEEYNYASATGSGITEPLVSTDDVSAGWAAQTSMQLRLSQRSPVAGEERDYSSKTSGGITEPLISTDDVDAGLAAQMSLQLSLSQQSPVTEREYNYASNSGGGITEPFVSTDDVSTGLAAQTSMQLRLSERETYGTDSSYVDSYYRQPVATPTHVMQSDVLQTAAEDAVVAPTRRPSIKELKSRFEAEVSYDTSVREAAQFPPSTSAAGYRHQFQSSSLKAGSRGCHGHTASEFGETNQRKLSFDARRTNAVASASSSTNNSSKNSTPKGRFITRSSIAASNLPMLPNDANIDQAEQRHFERLVDRRKVFEAADTQPVA